MQGYRIKKSSMAQLDDKEVHLPKRKKSVKRVGWSQSHAIDFVTDSITKWPRSPLFNATAVYRAKNTVASSHEWA